MNNTNNQKRRIAVKAVKKSKNKQTSKKVVANLTNKRSDDLNVLWTVHPPNTFQHPHYFQDPNAALLNKTSSTMTPQLVPRQIHFSAECSKDVSNLKTAASQDDITLEVERLHKQLEEVKNYVKTLQNDKAAAKSEIQKVVSIKEHETKLIQEELVTTKLRLNNLQAKLDNKTKDIDRLQEENRIILEMKQKLSEKSLEIKSLLGNVERLQQSTQEKSDIISKQEKNLANYEQNEEVYLRRIAELEERLPNLIESSAILADLRLAHSKCSTEIEECKRKISEMNLELQEKDDQHQQLINQLSCEERRIVTIQEHNSSLLKEIEKVRSLNSDSSKQFSVDEIAKQVEKEINYSAQLDSNILRAIESEEENNFDVTSGVKTETSDDDNYTLDEHILNKLYALKAQVKMEQEHSEDIRKQLVIEKQHSQDIQEQDVAIIEAMRKRLEEALEKEEELHRLLDNERDKCERLATQISVFQRAEARKSSSLLKSPTESPRRSPRTSDFESELADRLKSEIKLLTAQNERERERIVDLQRNVEREKCRFEKELNDRVEYCERLKKEMDKLVRDKDIAEQEVEHLQERLNLQSQEIESLEARIATFQEAETRYATRRDRQLVQNTQSAFELQDLKTKVAAMESERDHLTQTMALLRHDIESGAKREAKLADALSNASNSECLIPQQFMQKMKDINALLLENTKENRQMAETVQFLVDERRTLQKRCEELESQSNINVTELEERANHLLGRFLRLESHRKALVYQKRYLKISLQSYQDSEERVKALTNGDITGTNVLFPRKRNKQKLFKTVALAIVAIQRMKFIGRIWQTGKRIVSKSVFTITQQKRSRPLAETAVSTSPPCRDSTTCNTFNLVERPALQAPALLNNTHKFEWPRLH